VIENQLVGFGLGQGCQGRSQTGRPTGWTLARASCLPTGRNSALFRQQLL